MAKTFGRCFVCGEEFHDETSYRQYVTGERHQHRRAVRDTAEPEEASDE